MKLYADGLELDIALLRRLPNQNFSFMIDVRSVDHRNDTYYLDYDVLWLMAQHLDRIEALDKEN